jgi:hypothetical protein
MTKIATMKHSHIAMKIDVTRYSVLVLHELILEIARKCFFITIIFGDVM